jgi:dual specificity phosphatase 12
MTSEHINLYDKGGHPTPMPESIFFMLAPSWEQTRVWAVHIHRNSIWEVCLDLIRELVVSALEAEKLAKVAELDLGSTKQLSLDPAISKNAEPEVDPLAGLVCQASTEADKSFISDSPQELTVPFGNAGCKEGKTLYNPVVLSNCDQILPFLYLGGVDAVADTDRVSDQGIRAVVCCLRDLEFPAGDFSNDLEYYRVDVEDISREPIELFFPEAAAFIHSWVSREQPVLVHCRAGVSRSASVVMAYLMTYQGYSLHDAFFLVRSRRSCVSPNVGFMEKLCDYEEAQQDTDTTVDMNKYISWYTTEGRAAVPDLVPE